MNGLVPILLLLCSSLLATKTTGDSPTAEFCGSDTNYTRGSAFQANLDALLASLPATAAAASTGFATNITTTTGASSSSSDQQAAYGLAQCRADVVGTSACGTCLDGTAQDVAASRCAGQKKATLVYDNCLLRISDESFFGAADTSGIYLSNPQNATDPEQFTPRLGALMSDLARKAALESPRMFAVGSAAAATIFENIYGMAQCTRDLAADDCNRCLVNAVSSIPSCCGAKKGGQIIYASCSIRFEVTPFYNIQAAEAAMSSLAPAPAPGGGFVNGSNGSNHTVRTALIVSIPVAVALLVLLLVVAYLCNRNRQMYLGMVTARMVANCDEML